MAKKANKATPLYERARKIGMSDAMIATYTDEVALKKACDGISPRSNPDAEPKQVNIPEPVVIKEEMPDKFEFESRLEYKSMMRNRDQFDRNNLQLELRKINRKWGEQKPVKIVKTTTFKPVKGINEDKIASKFLITRFEIFLKESY